MKDPDEAFAAWWAVEFGRPIAGVKEEAYPRDAHLASAVPTGMVSYCTRCGRKLLPFARRRVYGPKCWHRLAGPVAALEADGNPAAAKAAELLREGGLVRLRGHGGRVWHTVGSTGRTYLTTREACTCRHGLFSILFDKMCHHRVAVILMESV